MDFKQIQELIKMVNKSNIGELTVEQKDFRITIKQKEDKLAQMQSMPVQAAPVYTMAPQPTSSQQSSGSSTTTEKSKPAESSSGNFVTIKSPMIGTFYRK